MDVGFVDEQAAADAFGWALERHRDPLTRRLALISGDAEEARDLVQEAFTRAIKHGPFATPEDEGRWLATVGARLAIDERRRRRRWGFLPVRETDAQWAIEVDADLWRALARLDRRTRGALVMTALDGFTQDEAAEALGVPRGTLASWLARARPVLQAALAEDRQ
ncbi:MAG TPA: RNA polymerase sigma factor [Candidatus Limnocylindrales bacterium]